MDENSLARMLLLRNAIFQSMSPTERCLYALHLFVDSLECALTHDRRPKNQQTQNNAMRISAKGQ